MFGWALIRKRRLCHIPIARKDGAKRPSPLPPPPPTPTPAYCIGAYTYKCSYNGHIDDFIDPCSGLGLGVFFGGGGLEGLRIERPIGLVACMLLVLMLFILKDLLHDDLFIFDVGDTISFCRFAVA